MRINVWVVLIVLIALPMTRAPRCVCGELRTPCIRARRTGSRFKNPTAPAVKREAEEDWGK
jgi:hypothetical protein